MRGEVSIVKYFIVFFSFIHIYDTVSHEVRYLNFQHVAMLQQRFRNDNLVNRTQQYAQLFTVQQYRSTFMYFTEAEQVIALLPAGVRNVTE